MVEWEPLLGHKFIFVSKLKIMAPIHFSHFCVEEESDEFMRMMKTCVGICNTVKVGIIIDGK